jgi:predicted nucleotidyltransferase
MVKPQSFEVNNTHGLNTIVSRLVETLHPEQIILFGSYAYGNPNQDSDFDLLVIVSKSDQPQYRRSRVAYSALRGLSAPTDVIVMTRQEVEKKLTVRSSLVKQAVEQGQVLYG